MRTFYKFEKVPIQLLPLFLGLDPFIVFVASLESVSVHHFLITMLPLSGLNFVFYFTYNEVT